MQVLDSNIKDKIKQSKLSQTDKDRLAELLCTSKNNEAGVFFDPIVQSEFDQLVRKM